MRRFKLTYHPLVLLLSIICLAGCSQEELMEKQDMEQSGVNAQLVLSLNMPQSSTRAASISPLPGTATENQCNRLTLFLIGTTNASDIQVFTMNGDISLNKTTIFNIDGTKGEKKILVAANMSDTQIKQIKDATDHNPVLTIDDIIDIATEGKFIMTGQALDESNNSETITIKANQVTKIKATLTRVMSKVLLTCTTQNKDGIKYAKLAQDNGYIRLKDVRYLLKTTNKKFFPFAKANNEDPNFAMDETLGKDYSFNFFDKTTDEKNGAAAVKFDRNRLEDGDDRYVEGLYCLENTISGIQDDYSLDLSDPHKVATHLKIAAKFTPKNIDGMRDLSESEAMSKLTDGTFYTCIKSPVKAMCYSSPEKGIEYLKSQYNLDTTAEDFVLYEEGWQRYDTFVNTAKEFNTGAGVLRSNYYILNVKSFTAPVMDKTIEVNTTIAGWVTKGKTTIDIETGNNK